MTTTCAEADAARERALIEHHRDEAYDEGFATAASQAARAVELFAEGRSDDEETFKALLALAEQVRSMPQDASLTVDGDTITLTAPSGAVFKLPVESWEASS